MRPGEMALRRQVISDGIVTGKLTADTQAMLRT
jgi:hypothetical protein